MHKKIQDFVCFNIGKNRDECLSIFQCFFLLIFFVSAMITMRCAAVALADNIIFPMLYGGAK